MNNGIISLSDYQLVANGMSNGSIGGSTTQGNVNDLVKALEAGSITGGASVNNANASGASLKIESLDKMLKHLTYRESDVRFYKRIKTLPAYSTVEEFNQLSGYGTEESGFYREGELPQEENSNYIRRSQLVKYMGVVKSVSHPMTLVNTNIGPVVTKEIENGTMHILRTVNRGMAFGDEEIIPENFNGLYTQHQKNDSYASVYEYLDSSVVIDCRGAILTEGLIEKAAQTIVENYGLAGELFMPPAVLSKFSDQFYSKKLIQPNTPAQTDGKGGQVMNGFDSQYGRINFTWDTFLSRERTRAHNAAATSSSAPAAPVPDVTTPIAAVAATAANTKWGANDAGTYFYAVAAVNRFGVSAMAVMSASGTAIAQNGAVDLKFAAGAGAQAATGYIIYRSAKGAASSTSGVYTPLFRVSTANLANGYNGGAASVIRDLNQWMPGTEQAILMQNDEDVVAFRQLAPLMKMDLAILSPAYRFMVLMYGTPLLFAPKKMVRFINIGV